MQIVTNFFMQKQIRRVKPKPRRYEKAQLEELDKGNGSIRLSVEEAFVHPLYVSE